MPVGIFISVLFKNKHSFSATQKSPFSYTTMSPFLLSLAPVSPHPLATSFIYLSGLVATVFLE